jgi:hypothetical protein
MGTMTVPSEASKLTNEVKTHTPHTLLRWLFLFSIVSVLFFVGFFVGNTTVWREVVSRCHHEGEVAPRLCAPCAYAAADNPLNWSAVPPRSRIDSGMGELTNWCLDRVTEPISPPRDPTRLRQVASGVWL